MIVDIYVPPIWPMGVRIKYGVYVTNLRWQHGMTVHRLYQMQKDQWRLGPMNAKICGMAAPPWYGVGPGTTVEFFDA